MSRITIGGVIGAATLFGAIVAAGPLFAAGADQATAPTPAPAPAQTQTTAAPTIHDLRVAERGEERIIRMHDRLRITSTQEDAWSKVAKVMRDNAAAFRTAIGERYSNAKPMTAIDDLKSFQMIADEHSSGLKRLVPAFETLYGVLTPDQQKRADRMFEHRERNAFN